jgi:hypothetical protein
MPNRTRVLAPVFVENMPTIICDADGVLVTNQLGDQIHSWRMSRHKALNIAASISAAVALWERHEARKPNNVKPFAHRAAKARAGH